MSAAVPTARLGIAGVNTRALHAATLRIAGTQDDASRQRGTTAPGAPPESGAQLGDRAATACWAHAAYLLDYGYLVCPDRGTGQLRWRAGFAERYGPPTRRLPVYLDSAAYRAAAGTAPAWASYARYSQALEMVRPDGAMAPDVLDDQAASRAGRAGARLSGHPRLGAGPICRRRVLPISGPVREAYITHRRSPLPKRCMLARTFAADSSLRLRGTNDVP